MIFFILLPAAQTSDKNAVNPEQMKKLIDRTKSKTMIILLSIVQQELNKVIKMRLLVQIKRLLLPLQKYLLFEMQTVLLVYLKKKKIRSTEVSY